MYGHHRGLLIFRIPQPRSTPRFLPSITIPSTLLKSSSTTAKPSAVMANEVRSDHNARDEIIDSHADEHLEISALEYTLTERRSSQGDRRSTGRLGSLSASGGSICIPFIDRNADDSSLVYDPEVDDTWKEQLGRIDLGMDRLCGGACGGRGWTAVAPQVHRRAERPGRPAGRLLPLLRYHGRHMDRSRHVAHHPLHAPWK